MYSNGLPKQLDPKLIKLKRSKGIMGDYKAAVRLWLLERKTQSGWGIPGWREVDLSFREEEMTGRPGTQRTANFDRSSRRQGRRQMSHLCPLIPPTATKIIPDIIKTVSRSAFSIVRSMKGTMIYFDGPSDIDFNCRVCKSKKCANVHSYSWRYSERDLLIWPQKASLPVCGFQYRT